MGCGSRKDNIKAFSNFMVSISMKTRKINSNVVQRKKTTTTSVLVKILFFLACPLSLGLFIFNPIILRFDNVLLFSPHSLHFFVFVFIGNCCFFCWTVIPIGKFNILRNRWSLPGVQSITKTTLNIPKLMRKTFTKKNIATSHIWAVVKKPPGNVIKKRKNALGSIWICLFFSRNTSVSSSIN